MMCSSISEYAIPVLDRAPAWLDRVLVVLQKDYLIKMAFLSFYNCCNLLNIWPILKLEHPHESL